MENTLLIFDQITKSEYKVEGLISFPEAKIVKTVKAVKKIKSKKIAHKNESRIQIKGQRNEKKTEKTKKTKKKRRQNHDQKNEICNNTFDTYTINSFRTI